MILSNYIQELKKVRSGILDIIGADSSQEYLQYRFYNSENGTV